jgi:hypothetical protein
MDPARGICMGCGRTLDEIGRWGSMSESERANLMERLPERLSTARTREQDFNAVDAEAG